MISEAPKSVLEMIRRKDSGVSRVRCRVASRVCVASALPDWCEFAFSFVYPGKFPSQLGCELPSFLRWQSGIA